MMLKKILLLLLISVYYRLSIADSTLGLPASRVKASAPHDYIVKGNDSVLGVVHKYLTKLSYWPQLLGVTDLSQCRLYPGDQLHLLTLDGRKVVVVDHVAARVTTKLQPQVRSLDVDALPPISTKFLRNLFNHPLLYAESEFGALAIIVGGADLGALYYSAGDIIYVKGLAGQVGDKVVVLSKFRQLVDPDTHAVLGNEVRYDGEGVVEQSGPVSSVRLTNALNQIADLDRVTIMPDQSWAEIVPHKAESSINGKIIGLYDSLTATAENNSVVINRGALAGVEAGQVFNVVDSRTIVDPTSNQDHDRYLVTPSQVIGEMMIYKVYPQVSFGLITDSSRPILYNAVVQSQQ